MPNKCGRHMTLNGDKITSYQDDRYLAILAPVIPMSVSTRYRMPVDGLSGIGFTVRSYILNNRIFRSNHNKKLATHVSSKNKAISKTTTRPYIQPIPYAHLQLEYASSAQLRDTRECNAPGSSHKETKCKGG